MKKKVDLVEHEKRYIDFLTRHLEWLKKDPALFKEEIVKTKYKLDKARLVLKTIS